MVLYGEERSGNRVNGVYKKGYMLLKIVTLLKN
jgi:hypothetical protein